MMASEKLLNVRTLYVELADILQKEAPQEAVPLIRTIHHAVGLASETLDTPGVDDEQAKATLRELGLLHIRMNQPRVGLSDFFIWRDDFDERMEVNRRLNEVRDEVWRILDQYC